MVIGSRIIEVGEGDGAHQFSQTLIVHVYPLYDARLPLYLHAQPLYHNLQPLILAAQPLKAFTILFGLDLKQVKIIIISVNPYNKVSGYL
ncbi:hypothetical protein CSV80_14900 [Sporosarcina sp. P12(2017)]|uniref:hypothetical protein n=1 Tax=unclassified Sporosarcina TaxID=2647733 RepID=UPI000C17322B|nr:MULTISPECIES: hypothetical protein [unclassified Sporosarcina]PIC56382.1 hypothetical protein CSV81_14765 [Sporosarcina sp. P10]PIC59679.1 hypothetical protein CSV80_14900 [Sporosarcina sp. P12(2017)]